MELSHPLATVVPSLDGAVLEALATAQSPLPMRRIAALSSRGSVSGVSTVLRRLVIQGLVDEQPLGSVILYSANREHILWPAIELALGSRDQLFSEIASDVGGWPTAPLSVSVFGSVARRESTSESDLDILILWKEPVDAVSDNAQYDLSLNITRRTGNPVQLYVITMNELSEHIRVDEPIVARWRDEARTLFGTRMADVIRKAGG